MSVTLRVMKPDEYADLPSAPPAEFERSTAMVMIALDESGRVVGRAALVVRATIEARWIAPEHAETGLLRMLDAELADSFKFLGISRVTGLARTPSEEARLAKEGFEPVAGTLWEKPILLPDHEQRSVL